MKRLLFILLIVPVMANAQQISVSPTSIPVWGQAPQVSKISASYMDVEAVYMYGFKTMYDKQGGRFGGGYFGLFWNPLVIESGDFEFRGGAGYFFRKFPTVNGTHINFQIKATYKITDTFGISYQHVSNGFGAFNSLNPGADNLSITINFK